MAAGDANLAGTAWDNQISSVQIPAGLRVTLFDGPSFTGRSLVLTQSSDCLMFQGFNKAASSMRISECTARAPRWRYGGACCKRTERH